jgi:transposase
MTPARSHQRHVADGMTSTSSPGLQITTNTKIRLITRIAFGFHSAEALIALAMLTLGGHRPPLPGRK